MMVLWKTSFWKELHTKGRIFYLENKTKRMNKKKDLKKQTNQPTWLAKLQNVYENTWYMKIHMYTHIWLKDQR